ncbi:hypothetical protein B0T22DRAFT_56781 [Podospora appendiculata]|uniref:Uncharacterized protein n=1 Tax=Podospora appendiculata TaxID=314037 RepID=A0AAE1CGP6_9PEZI|nr:hypothetical protein B0T22DRAFT_56781 [Podospora appendiculata]
MEVLEAVDRGITGKGGRLTGPGTRCRESWISRPDWSARLGCAAGGVCLSAICHTAVPAKSRSGGHEECLYRSPVSAKWATQQGHTTSNGRSVRSAGSGFSSLDGKCIIGRQRGGRRHRGAVVREGTDKVCRSNRIGSRQMQTLNARLAGGIRYPRIGGTVLVRAT